MTIYIEIWFFFIHTRHVDSLDELCFICSSCVATDETCGVLSFLVHSFVLFFAFFLSFSLFFVYGYIFIYVLTHVYAIVARYDTRVHVVNFSVMRTNFFRNYDCCIYYYYKIAYCNGVWRMWRIIFDNCLIFF